jgi:hypothetical protein
LAVQYGISDVGLAKVCRRYNIPRPPRGYWAKIQAGQRARKTPLPKISDPRYAVIAMRGWDMPDETVQTLVNDVKVAHKGEVAPPQNTPPHTFTELARQQLLAAKPDHDGLLRTDPATAPELRMSPPLVDRCLSVLDGFIKKWEERGGAIPMGTDSPVRTAIAVGPDEFYFRIVEGLDESKPLTDSTRRTGHLTLYIDGDEDRQFRRRWSDTKTQRLEKMFKPLIETVMHALEVKKLDRLDHECEQRQKKKVQAIRNAAAEVGNQEFYWRQELMENVSRWHDAQRIRAYLTALEQAIEGEKFRPNNPEGCKKWLRWAHWYADSIDPVTRAQRQEETLRGPTNTPVSDLDLTSYTRPVVESLGAKDTNELWRVSQDKVREACDGKYGNTWNEITRVLEGLGYDVSKRPEASYWW